MIEEIAENVYQLYGFPKHGINSYVIDDVLIDAGTRFSARRILRDISRFNIRAHALTHAHPDHFGASKKICDRLRIPLWVGAGDAVAVETVGLMYDRFPRHRVPRILSRLQGGPPVKVDRRLREGDRVGSFIVIDAPGHTAGHIAFWRASDRTLLLGDVANGHQPFTGTGGVREPFDFLTADPPRNQRSIARLAALQPALVCFGHGPPLCNADGFSQFAAAVQSHLRVEPAHMASPLMCNGVGSRINGEIDRLHVTEGNPV